MTFDIYPFNVWLYLYKVDLMVQGTLIITGDHPQGFRKHHRLVVHLVDLVEEVCLGTHLQRTLIQQDYLAIHPRMQLILEGLIGKPPSNTTNTGGLFGNLSNTNTANTGGLFGNQSNTNPTSGGLFNNNNNKPTAPGSLFGTSSTNAATSNNLFGSSLGNTASSGTSLFGNTASSMAGSSNPNADGNLFGASAKNNLFTMIMHCLIRHQFHPIIVPRTRTVMIKFSMICKRLIR